MTRAEAIAYNQGIETMRAIARASADKIEATDPRPIVASFAVVSLRGLADDAAMLLLPIEPKPDAGVSNGSGSGF